MKRRGFTLVELSISIAFVATLLITVALIINQIMSIYQKGLALRAVNSTGRELIDEFTRGIAMAPVKGVNFLCHDQFDSNSDALTECINDGAEILTYYERYVNVDGADVPVSGTFCTGRYSYIWNTGYALNNPGQNNSNRARLVASDYNYDSDTFRLLRVADGDREICKANVRTDAYNYNSPSGQITYNISPDDEPLEVLANSQDNLVLYDFVAFPGAIHTITQHGFYSATFVLGTLQGGVNILSTGDYCTDIPSEALNTDFNYCAVNKFNFSVRATGELTDEERIERGHY